MLFVQSIIQAELMDRQQGNEKDQRKIDRKPLEREQRLKNRSEMISQPGRQREKISLWFQEVPGIEAATWHCLKLTQIWERQINVLTQCGEWNSKDVPPRFPSPSYSINHQSRHCCKGTLQRELVPSQVTLKYRDYPGLSSRSPL